MNYNSIVVQFFKVLHLWIGATMRCYLASRSQHSDLTFHQALLTFTTLSIHVSTPTSEWSNTRLPDLGLSFCVKRSRGRLYRTVKILLTLDKANMIFVRDAVFSCDSHLGSDLIVWSLILLNVISSDCMHWSSNWGELKYVVASFYHLQYKI